MNHNNMSREGRRHGGGQENIGRCIIKDCNFQLYQDVCICPAKCKKNFRSRHWHCGRGQRKKTRRHDFEGHNAHGKRGQRWGSN